MVYDRLGDTDNEKAAIHELFRRSTIPILAKIGERFAVIGTGTLFEIANRYFLISAAHTADDHPPHTWLFPVNPAQGRILPFSESVFTTPPDASHDISIRELQDPDKIDILKKSWQFLTMDHIWLPDYSADAILVSGYPSEKATFKGPNLHGRLVVVRQSLKADVPDAVVHSTDPLTKGVDFFINYQDSVNELTGEDISEVSVRGMSGCSIWAYRKRGWTSHSIWTTQACLRVIGIQSAAVTNKYLRAKSWGAVLETMTMMDDELDAEAKTFVRHFMERIGYRPSDEH